MCGLIICRENINDLKALKSMSHRGLINHFERDKGYFIGHNTLPIASLDEDASYQPKLNFVFTGEVFNYKTFGNFENDTRTVRMLFHDNSLSNFLRVCHQFNGFWGIAGIKENKLVAITDYLNQKPLYYRTDIKAVASEPHALSLLGPTNPDPLFYSNIQKWGYDMTNRTPWEEIKMIPPGCYYLDGEIKQYWDWNKIILREDLRSLLYEETIQRLKGQRKIALLLSGGLDSSIVYYIAKTSNIDVDCFHVENDESEYVKEICPEVNLVKLAEVTRKESIIAHQSPVDLGSVVPQMALAKTLKDLGYHVCLSGDGADELFGGYRRINEYDSQQSDVFHELPYYHHPRLDRIMMSKTIELRSPFLSSKVVKYALNLPYWERKNKKILKDLFPELPQSILNREKKALKTSDIQKDLLKNTKENINLFMEMENDKRNLSV